MPGVTPKVQKVERLPANRITALKVLLDGGCVEKRRIYPFLETYHLRKREPGRESPKKLDEVVVEDLIMRRLIQPTRTVDPTSPGDSDNLDFIAAPGIALVIADHGIRYEDTQEQMFAEIVDTPSHRTSIEPE